MAASLNSDFQIEKSSSQNMLSRELCKVELSAATYGVPCSWAGVRLGLEVEAASMVYVFAYEAIWRFPFRRYNKPSVRDHGTP